MSDVTDSSKGGGRRRRRRLTVEEKYEIYLGMVTGEMTQSEAADRYGVDRSTVARIRVTGRCDPSASDVPTRTSLRTRAAHPRPWHVWPQRRRPRSPRPMREGVVPRSPETATVISRLRRTVIAAEQRRRGARASLGDGGGTWPVVPLPRGAPTASCRGARSASGDGTPRGWGGARRLLAGQRASCRASHSWLSIARRRCLPGTPSNADSAPIA